MARTLRNPRLNARLARETRLSRAPADQVVDSNSARYSGESGTGFSLMNPAVVRIPRRVFQYLLDQSPIPERCVEAFHVNRTRFELIAEKKIRRRQLTDDGNLEITGRDLRERSTREPSHATTYQQVA
jgi:hypothetical protein